MDGAIGRRFAGTTMGGVVGIVSRRFISALQELPPLSMPFGGGDPARVRARFGSYRGLVRLLLATL